MGDTTLVEVQEVMYPCTFPRCTSGHHGSAYLGVDQLYVPSLVWINREVGRRRTVTDWFNAATEGEMSSFARCRHHAFESVVGLEYNKRRGIGTMYPFRDVIKQSQFQRELAQSALDEARAAYRYRHQQEREARRARRLAAKSPKPSAAAVQVAASKKYGDEHVRIAVAEPTSDQEKGKKQRQGMRGGGR